MKLIKIDRQKVMELLGAPYNPPRTTAETLGRAFLEEWYDVRSGLVERLEQFGEHNYYGNGDFGVGEDIVGSRGIEIDITKAKMLEPEVLVAIQDYVRSIESDYTVYFSFNVDGKMADVFVQKELVYVHCPDEALRVLGWDEFLE